MRTEDVFDTYSVKIRTPDGTMFVHVAELEAQPKEILINIGKAGSNLSAWGDATARLATALIPKIGIHGIIQEISGITSDKLSQLGAGAVCRSGPEGLAIALYRYRSEKYKENKPRIRDGSAKSS